MSNYTYGWKLKEDGWEEIPWREWVDLKGAETYGKKDYYRKYGME